MAPRSRCDVPLSVSAAAAPATSGSRQGRGRGWAAGLRCRRGKAGSARAARPSLSEGRAQRSGAATVGSNVPEHVAQQEPTGSGRAARAVRRERVPKGAGGPRHRGGGQRARVAEPQLRE